MSVNDGLHPCPHVHERLRQAVKLFDDAAEMSTEGDQLLVAGASESQIHDAAHLLAGAGFKRVQGVAAVQLAWIALCSHTASACGTPTSQR